MEQQEQQPEATTRRRRVPLWVLTVIILCLLPGLAFPWMMKLASASNAVINALIWFYPAYVACSGLLAWQCYGRRSAMTWIILCLLLLSHAAFYYLAFLAGVELLTNM